MGDYFGAGIDDTHMKVRGAPVLDEPSHHIHQKMIADKLSVSELMASQIIALPPVVKVSHFRGILPVYLSQWAIVIQPAGAEKVSVCSEICVAFPGWCWALDILR